MRILFLIMISCLLVPLHAQNRKKQNTLVTLRGNIGIQKPISSQMFLKSFAGLYEGNLAISLRMFDNFYAGAGYQNTHFKNNASLRFVYFNANIPYNTRLIGHGAFLKLGYDQFFSDKGFMSYALNTGFMMAGYTNVNADTTVLNRPFTSTKFNAPYLQPEISANFMAEERLCFSVFFSYTTLFHHFDPKAPRFAHLPQVLRSANRHGVERDHTNNYLMSWFNLGFGFTVLLGKK